MPAAMSDVIPEVAHQMGMLPLLWLGALHLRGQKRDPAFWWIGAAFAVSWLADTAAHWLPPDLVGNLYPVMQTGLIAAALLDRSDAYAVVAVVTLSALAAIIWRGVLGIDLMLRTVAWGTVAALVYWRPQLGRLRTALLVTFGAGLVTWYAYAFAPGWTTWGVYQVSRLAGIILLCGATLRPFPSLKVAR